MRKIKQVIGNRSRFILKANYYIEDIYNDSDSGMN